jgi:hypothetical protein
MTVRKETQVRLSKEDLERMIIQSLKLADEDSLIKVNWKMNGMEVNFQIFDVIVDIVNERWTK